LTIYGYARVSTNGQSLDAQVTPSREQVNAVHLRRVDPARNMCRFYRLDVQPIYSGAYCS
jgi:hypothetical protein